MINSVVNPPIPTRRLFMQVAYPFYVELWEASVKASLQSHSERLFTQFTLDSLLWKPRSFNTTFY